MSHASNEKEGMKLTNHEKIRTLGKKETYKYMGILEVDTIKQVEMKERIKKECLRRTKKLLENKLHSKNFKRINTWAVPLRRYSVLILKWIKKELKQIDQRQENSRQCIRPYITEMTLIDYMGQENEKEHLPTLKIAWMHRYNDSKITEKSVE